MLRPASQETCLEHSVHGRGVRVASGELCGMTAGVFAPANAPHELLRGEVHVFEYPYSATWMTVV